jgi:hypothetical protein
MSMVNEQGGLVDNFLAGSPGSIKEIMVLMEPGARARAQVDIKQPNPVYDLTSNGQITPDKKIKIRQIPQHSSPIGQANSYWQVFFIEQFDPTGDHSKSRVLRKMLTDYGKPILARHDVVIQKSDDVTSGELKARVSGTAFACNGQVKPPQAPGESRLEITAGTCR